MQAYDEAHEWITHHSGTAEAMGLAKLILSLHHRAYAFGFRECVEGLGDELTALAMRVATQYVRVGREDESMLDTAVAVAEAFPDLSRYAEAVDRLRAGLDAE